MVVVHQRSRAAERTQIEGPTAVEGAGSSNSAEVDALSSRLEGAAPDPSFLAAAVRELREAEGDPEPDEPADPAPALGDRTTPVSGGGADPGGDDGMEAGFVCPALPPGFSDTLGLTRPNGTFVGPKLEISATEQESEEWWDPWATSWNASIAATTAKDGVHWSVATPPGTHSMGTETFDGEAYEMVLEVDASAFGQIVAAEKEHLDDYLQAYTITLQAAADVVNAMSESDFFAATEADAKADALEAVNSRLHPKLRVEDASLAELTWQIANANLILGTRRDENHWHSAKTVLKKGGIDLKKRRMTFVIDFSGTQIGTHPSSEHVTLDNLP
ncbi:MAG: hypothetical protein ABMA64_29755 [Myxococcota bacterium]